MMERSRAQGARIGWMALFAVTSIQLASIDASAQTADAKKTLPKFEGREITLIPAEVDENGFAKGPASVCLEAPPRRQCYRAPEDYGVDLEVSVIQITKGKPAVFFSANARGLGGFSTHFALLRPGFGNELSDLLGADTSVSDQSWYTWWNMSAISDAPIFVTADFIWGPSDGRFTDHRYTISAYVWVYSSITRFWEYHLMDRYMTADAYSLSGDILATERLEILARLARIKAANGLPT